MQIALVRHGRPRVDAPRRIPSGQFSHWVGAYDRAGLDPSAPPPRRLRDLAASCPVLLSSDLPRAVESLRMLAPGRCARAESLFREAGLPRLPSFPGSFDPQLWAVLSRGAWLLGWSPSGESAARARRRARDAARELESLAAEHGPVLLVGHGIFNLLIARQLRSRSWRGPAWPLGRYWFSAVYRKDPVRRL